MTEDSRLHQSFGQEHTTFSNTRLDTTDFNTAGSSFPDVLIHVHPACSTRPNACQTHHVTRKHSRNHNFGPYKVV